MGDEEDGLADGGLEGEELVLEAFADDGVDGAEGLVHEEDGRVGGEGAGDADALALAAGELGGVAGAVGGRVEADEVEEFGGTRACGRLLPAEEGGDGRGVVEDGAVGKSPTCWMT